MTQDSLRALALIEKETLKKLKQKAPNEFIVHINRFRLSKCIFCACITYSKSVSQNQKK